MQLSLLMSVLALAWFGISEPPVSHAAPCERDASRDRSSDCAFEATCSHNADCADDGIACTSAYCDEDERLCRALPDDVACDDGDDCTEDICDPASGCAHLPVCESDDPGICRPPRFWATHSGYDRKGGDKPVNVGQQLLETTGPLKVCGRTISTTSRSGFRQLQGLGTTSALEGLCVRPGGIPQRRLYRELVAAALNCAASGSANACDDRSLAAVGISFDACNRLCAGTASQESPAAEECIEMLRCFNEGGLAIGGVCAFGTCEKQPEIACGGPSGECPDFADLPQRCVEIDRSCRDAELCNDELGFCPGSTAPSSTTACREARRNDCTIDSCP
jgi:hypothetical protein